MNLRRFFTKCRLSRPQQALAYLQLRVVRLSILLTMVASTVFPGEEVRGTNEEIAGDGVQYRAGAYFPAGFPLHGKVKLLTASTVQAGRRERVRIEYTVGDIPLDAGISLEVWTHFTSDVEEFQVSDPGAPAYFSVEFSATDVEARTKGFSNSLTRDDPSVFPYRKKGAVTIRTGQLIENDTVRLDLGGPPGVRMQQYAENLFNFRIAIVRDGKVLGYGGDANLKVVGGPLKKLRVVAPSIVQAGASFPLEIVPLDTWGSLAKDHFSLSFRITSQGVTGGDIRYDATLRHYVAVGLVVHTPGIVRIDIETTQKNLRGTAQKNLRGKAQKNLRGTSNPIWVRRQASQRVYYGELHQHSYLHDGRGVFEELYLNARRVGLLDFAALTSHHGMIKGVGPNYHLKDYDWQRDHWPEIEEANKKMNGWQGLVTILGYEYSVSTGLGGHHNVYYNADKAPTQMHLDPLDPNIAQLMASDPGAARKKIAPIAKLLRTLEQVRKPTLVIPHIGGGPPDWSHPTDPRMERLFEIASVHGVFEESYFRHLESGIRLAASAAGDTHTTSMGSAYPGLLYTMTNPLTGVFASGKSRDQIWDGLYQKRTFAMTGNTRMLIDFSVNGVSMGGDLPSGLAEEARIESRVSATAPILRVELLKNAEVIYSTHPARGSGDLLRVVWGDNLYQRRANDGLTSGSLQADRGSLVLKTAIHRDQEFERIRQDGSSIVWRTAAVSGDRDGFLVDISHVSGKELRFRLDDPDKIGTMEVKIPIVDLRRSGAYSWKHSNPEVRHSYLEKMGVVPTFFLHCDLVDPDGPMDHRLEYLDREAPKPGDYYLVRVEQLDTNKGWSSPVWIN